MSVCTTSSRVKEAVGFSIPKGPLLSIHCLGCSLSIASSQNNHTVPITCEMKNWDCGLG